MHIRPFTLSCVGLRLPICLRSSHIAHSAWFRHSFYGRAGFRLMALLANGQTLGQRCSCRSCALRYLLPPTRDWGAYYRRPASLTRRAGRHGCRRRRRRTARLRHAQRVCWRSSCSCMLFLLRPARGWLLRCRRYTIRVMPGRYVRRRLLCSFSSWPYHCRRGWQRWHTPSSWRSRRSLQRPRGLRGGAALILTCAALACTGARFISLHNMCRTVTLLLVGARLASILVLADLVATCWPTSRGLLRLCHVTPNLSLLLKPSQLGSQFPRGWWIYAFSPFSTCTAVSGSFRRPKAEGCRGLHNLDGSRSNGVSLRHSCGEAMWTSWSSQWGSEARLSQGAQPGRAGRTRWTYLVSRT